MDKEKQGIHHEDLALKTAAQYLGEELLRFMGVPGVVALAAPTETVKLEQVKEMIAMTRLGQMLVEDGIAQGIEQGIEQGIALTKRVLRLSAKGFTRDQIAEDYGIGRKEVDDILREEEDLCSPFHFSRRYGKERPSGMQAFVRTVCRRFAA